MTFSNRQSTGRVSGLARSCNLGAEMEISLSYENDSSALKELNDTNDFREMNEMSETSSSGVHVTDTSDEIFY